MKRAVFWIALAFAPVAPTRERNAKKGGPEPKREMAKS
jgi:hypothetical protein